MRTVPVVVVSTEGSEARIQELKERGVRGYIRKPFTPEAVKETVEGVLGERHA
jgi:two-component system chemotaxis response regulator CheY